MKASCSRRQVNMSSNGRLLYDRKEATRQLSISVRNLDYRIANRQIETRRIGKKVLIPHAALVRFASANHYDAAAHEGEKEAA